MRLSVFCVYEGGLPERAESLSPSIRLLAKRMRHLLTVDEQVLYSAAICFVSLPSAAARIISARKDMRCSVVPDRSQDSSVLLSSTVRLIGVALPLMILSPTEGICP